MSKLPKAPLLEVIFEINWDVTNRNDIMKFQYLHGDLYSILKEKYPIRESLAPNDIPSELMKGSPMYRFRKEKNGYPLVQVGPGLITFNTIDALYHWEEFRNDVKELTSVLVKIYPDICEVKSFPVLTYVDFFENEFDKQNVIEFLSENLNFKIENNFASNEDARNVNLDITYEMGDNKFSFSIKSGRVNGDKTGIILGTKLIGSKSVYKETDQINWLDESHEICSDLFKKITAGKLYESFK